MIKELKAVTELDHPDLTRMARLFYEESKLPGTFIPHYFISNWAQFMDKGIGAMWVAGEKDSLHGAIGLLIYPDVYNGDLVANEMFWFIDPVKRMGLDAVRLYKAAERWAKEKGAKRLAMACVCNKHMSSVRKFYEDRGFRPVDVSYFKNL